MNHVLTIDFTKFIGAEIITHEIFDGDEVQGIFIPFDLNEIRKGKKGTRFAQFFIVQKKNDYYFHQTHYVIPKYTDEHKSFMNSLGFKKPFIGHLTPCYDRTINKLSQKYALMEKKGYVKVNNETDEVDE